MTTRKVVKPAPYPAPADMSDDAQATRNRVESLRTARLKALIDEARRAAAREMCGTDEPLWSALAVIFAPEAEKWWNAGRIHGRLVAAIVAQVQEEEGWLPAPIAHVMNLLGAIVFVSDYSHNDPSAWPTVKEVA
jgi:hypothetical protein